MKKEKNTLILATVLILLFLSKNLLADENDLFKLTYRLIEGGENRLYLSDKDPYYKCVEITITKKNASISQEFEIFQEVGPGMERSGDSFKMYRLSQDFPGYFYVQTGDMTVTPGRTRIYKSNSTGTGLTFTLAYGLKNTDELEAGEYNTQINFILMPIFGIAFSQLKEPLYVKINIGEKIGVAPQIEIIPVTGLNTIYLNSQKEEKKMFDVGINISGSFDKVFSIIQRLPEPLLSNEGNQLDYGVINVQTSDVSKGMGIPITALSSREQTIYTSGPNGEAPENLMVTYSLGDLSGEKAGRYKSKIQFYLKKAEEPPILLKTIDLEVENERIFEIVITPEEQRSAIEFRDLKPREPPKKSEVILEVKTNVGKPYQVGQNVLSELTDKEGNTIPFENFTLRIETLETKGILKITDKQNVRKGDTILFVSDGKGSPDKFKIIYELTIPWEVKAGDYSTRITYSLLEI